MKKKLVVFSFLLVSQAFAETCSGYLRFVHGNAFNDQKVDLSLNGKTIYSNVEFRQVTNFIPVKSGNVSFKIKDTVTGEVLQEKSFKSSANLGHTIIFAGPAQGPQGMQYGNKSPFIILDDITPPNNPERWKGSWYRMSETNVVIDFRISDGKDPSQEIARLIKKPNRAVYQLGDFPEGNYQFNPVLVGSSEPFFNQALIPARNVELVNIDIRGGEIFDVFALGNFLGKAPNSLDLTYSKYSTSIDKEGCLVINN